MKPLALALGLVATAALGGPPALAAPDQSLERSVKAAFLYKFGSFVTWPVGALGGAQDAVQLCVVGDDPFGPVLEALTQGQTIDGRPIALRRMRAATRGAPCHIAFLAGSAEQSAAEAAAAFSGAPVLLVSEAQRAPDAVAVQFVMRANRVRFRVNQRAAAASNLTISAKLLNLATEVVR